MNTGKRIEWWFRHAVTYPTLRVLFRNRPYEGQLDLRSIRSILILRYDRFGDMVVTSPITRHLRTVNPGLRIGLAASASNAELARYLPGVDDVHVVSGPMARVVSSLYQGRKARYDVVLNFIFNRTTTGGIIANVMAPSGLKVGQGPEKYAFYFNRMVSLPRGSRHMVNLLDKFCSDVFGSSWGTPDLRYELADDPGSDERVNVALDSIARQAGMSAKDFIVVNISAGDPRRNPTPDQITYVARYLSERRGKLVVMVGAPSSYDRIRTIRRLVGNTRLMEYPLSGTAPFMDMVSLIRRASILVSPDTSLVHVASATQTPVVAMYSSFKDFSEWSPVGIPYEIAIDSETERVRTIAPNQITGAYERLLKRIPGVRKP